MAKMITDALAWIRAGKIERVKYDRAVYSRDVDTETGFITYTVVA